MSSQRAKDLDRLYESEVIGEITFSMASALSLSKSKRQKWAVLRRLESTTKSKLLRFLETTGETASCRPIVKVQAFFAGLGLAVLPWRLSMILIEGATKPFMTVFERLAAGAEGGSNTFFSFVVEHEHAIAEFAQRERSGANGTSLARAIRLLETAS